MSAPGPGGLSRRAIPARFVTFTPAHYGRLCPIRAKFEYQFDLPLCVIAKINELKFIEIVPIRWKNWEKWIFPMVWFI